MALLYIFIKSLMLNKSEIKELQAVIKRYESIFSEISDIDEEIQFSRCIKCRLITPVSMIYFEEFEPSIQKCISCNKLSFCTKCTKKYNKNPDTPLFNHGWGDICDSCYVKSNHHKEPPSILKRRYH